MKKSIQTFIDHLRNDKSTVSGLNSQEHWYQQIIECCPDLIAIIYNGKIEFINSPGSKLLGAESPDLLIGRSVKDFIHIQNHELCKQRLQMLKEGRHVSPIEEIFIRLDGTVFYADTSAMSFNYLGKSAILVVAHDITDHKLAEQTQLENDRWFRFFAQSTPDGIVLINQAGAIIYWNQGARNIFGYGDEEVLGKPSAMLLPEQDRETHRRGIEQLWQTGESSVLGRSFESRGLRKDGNVFPTEISISFWKTAEGVGYGAIIRDITEKTRIEQELRDSRETLYTLINAAPESLFLLDIDGTVLTANDTLARRMGTTINELIGSNIYNYLPSDLATSRRMFAEQAISERKMIYYEDTRQDRFMANYVHPFAGRSEDAARVAVFSWDITEHKHAEEELRRHRDHLDELVKEKTEELRNANEQLQEKITQHLLAEQALRASELNFRSLVELSPDGIGIERDGIVVFINSAGTNIFGAESAEQIIGKSVVELVHPDYRETVQERLSKVTTQGSISRFIELQFVRLDGSTIDVELGSTPCFYKNEQVAQAVFRDITKRKMIERTLHESEDKFRTLAETTASSIIIFQGTNIVYANPAAQILSGYTSEDLEKMNFWDIVHPSYSERSKDWGTRRQQGEELPSHLELPILRKNGEMRWVDYTAAVIDYLGAKAVLGTGIDITERKHAEEALRNSEEQYRMLVQSANSIILRMDTNGVVKFFNEFSQKFFGYAAEEILGRNVVGTIVPETDSSGRNLAEMIRDIGQRPDQYEFNQNENMRCNGERVWIAWTNKAIIDNDGTVREILCIGNDITMLKQAEEKLLYHKKQLQSLASELSLAEERERRRIAAELHDRIAQNLAVGKIKISELREMVTNNNCRIMIDVIDSILQQTIRETRSLSFELCPPYLYELGFETALEWLAERIQKNYNFTIHFECDKELKPMGDDIKVVLFQSTRELLVNIAKHAGARNAWVSVRKDNGNIRINVEDDGIGFDFAEAESRIGRSDGGFGLLSIRERINYLGGHLECESGEGRGTRISLVVPLRQS